MISSTVLDLYYPSKLYITTNTTVQQSSYLAIVTIFYLSTSFPLFLFISIYYYKGITTVPTTKTPSAAPSSTPTMHPTFASFSADRRNSDNVVSDDDSDSDDDCDIGDIGSHGSKDKNTNSNNNSNEKDDDLQLITVVFRSVHPTIQSSTTSSPSSVILKLDKHVTLQKAVEMLCYSLNVTSDMIQELDIKFPLPRRMIRLHSSSNNNTSSELKR